MKEGPKGFPSQIQDDSLLQIPMPAPDPFPMAEERRLFYVALTRARREVWIYTGLDQVSRFLIEMETDGCIAIEAVDGERAVYCPTCRVGTLKKISGRYGEFRGCSNYPRCRHTSKLMAELVFRRPEILNPNPRTESSSITPSSPNPIDFDDCEIPY
ncbi:topoisomerase DNA-binding C4 zinc finger domain-containing protein [Polymorphobacter fuscus]|uniref:topoisomerase DNA-binding C4 zinc finger domain-containing protein n=1 Tax=Sandarakinorhabdus fusca TaxID=1439888 RepID=UPI00142FEACA